jgi:stalled ribosome rescue protein Dom34
MKPNVGLWIDHQQAIIVTVGDKDEAIGRVASQVEKQLQRSGDSPLKGPYESKQVPADDSRQRAFTGHLNSYYDEVIALLRGAEAIVILGPGEAKNELKHRLEEKNIASRIVGIEPVDKMTDKQIVARVREHFVH